MPRALRVVNLTLLTSFSLAGCSLDGTTPTELRIQPAVGGQEKVTTGGATVSFFDGLIVNRMSFEAVRGQDGPESEGQFEFHGVTFFGGVRMQMRVHGLVRCFTIHGNSATIGGVITQSEEPFLIGQEVFWEVTDNGEGGNLPPDRMTSLFLGEAEPACLFLQGFFQFPIESGNIQVRGESSQPF